VVIGVVVEIDIDDADLFGLLIEDILAF